MKAFFSSMVCCLTLALVAGAQVPDKAKLVGFWEVVKSEEAPPGSTVQFTKDGKLILTFEKDGDEKAGSQLSSGGKQVDHDAPQGRQGRGQQPDDQDLNRYDPGHCGREGEVRRAEAEEKVACAWLCFLTVLHAREGTMSTFSRTRPTIPG